MFCKKCGTKLDDDALFCENCGTSTLPSQKKDDSAGLSTGPIEPIETPPVSISSDTKISSKPKRRVSYKWVVLLIVAVLGIIAAVLLIPFDANTSSDDFYHELNYNNNGFSPMIVIAYILSGNILTAMWGIPFFQQIIMGSTKS